MRLVIDVDKKYKKLFMEAAKAAQARVQVDQHYLTEAELRLSENSDYRIGFYLEGDTIVLSRILNRKDIYKKFPPKK